MTRPIDLVLERLEAVRRSGDSGNQWTACCPAHDDAHQSLSIGVDKDGKVLLWCHTGCPTENVVRSLGLSFAELDPHYGEREILPFRRQRKEQKPRPIKNEKTPEELQQLLDRCEADPDCVRGVERYAKSLGIPFQVLWDLGCRWKRMDIFPKNPNDPGELWYPERDGCGMLIGIGIRSWDGSKCFVRGSHRGLILLKQAIDRPGPLYLVEGLTDTATLLGAGTAAAGRPSNVSGVSALAELLLDRVASEREIVVVGENDQKEDGSWPGKTGADQTASELASLLNHRVVAALVPQPFKDTREWFQAQPSTTENLAEYYHQSLSVFASYPLISREVTEEEINANLIPFKESSSYAYPEELCPEPRHFLLQNKSTKKLQSSLTRCCRSECPHCFRRKRRLRLESLYRHFDVVQAAGGELHCLHAAMTKAEWDNLRKSIVRRGGNFIRYRQADQTFVLIATLPFRGSQPLSFSEATEYAQKASDNSAAAGRNKPFYTCSKQWSMRREKKDSVFKPLGILGIPPQAVKKICDRFLGRGRCKVVRLPDDDVLLKNCIDYAPQDPEPEKTDPLVLMLLGKDKSERILSSTSDSDIFPPSDYGIRCLPKDTDEHFGWWMNPTG